jgi:hypothetical protein
MILDQRKKEDQNALGPLQVMNSIFLDMILLTTFILQS